jgi:hypothetical protein
MLAQDGKATVWQFEVPDEVAELAETFDKPYKSKWEKSDYGDVDVLAKLPDGTNLSIMFNHEGGDEWQVEFYRDTSQALTSQGDAQRIFATVINAVQKFVKKHKPQLVRFSATKEVEPGQNSQSRAKLYNRIINRYANDWGYDAYQEDHGDQVTYELTRLNNNLAENFADHKLAENDNSIIDNKDGWGEVPNNREVDYLGMRIMMSPKTFIDLAAPLQEEPSDKILQHIQGGGKIASPFLVIEIPQSWEDGDFSMPARVIGHEGRNRMIAVEKVLGNNPIEVHVFPNKGMRARHITDEMKKMLNRGLVKEKSKSIVKGPLFSTTIGENFADGKKPGRKGLAKRSGVNTKASVSSLRKTAKNSTGEKQRMAHWLANMKAGRAKKKTKEAIAPHGSLENEFELMKAGVKPAALVNPHTFAELYKPIADQLGWPYQQIKIASNSYNTYAVGQPGEEKRVQRLVKLVQDMNANLAAGIKPDKEYHIEMGKLLGYSDEDIQDFLVNVNLAERTKQK